MTMSSIPFNQRFGVGLPPIPLDKEVPESARMGLIILLTSLCQDTDKQYVSWDALAAEALYVIRQRRHEQGDFSSEDIVAAIILELEWHKLYYLCERIYRRLHGTPEWDDNEREWVTGSPEEARTHFTEQANLLLAEEGLDYQFVDGEFQRRGRPQTQKNLQRVGLVLTEDRFAPARIHYNKAKDFFYKLPKPDEENCIKEAVCALEAFAELLFGAKAAKDFDGALRSKAGNGESEIPPALAEGMIKLRAFRGNAQGVAHAALRGGIVTVTEAELVLSLTATYITYLYDKFPNRSDDVPF